MDTTIFYDINPILTYNRPINIVIGVRGAGKTYSEKRLCIKKFLDKGRQFIWLRRYKDEITSDFRMLFFDDIKNEFTGHDFKVTGNNMYIDNNLAGFFVALSTAVYKKGTSYANVDLIVFDEFLIETKNIRYLPNEASAFDSFVSTVFRLRDGKAILLSNAVSVSNDYFAKYKLYPKSDIGFYKNDRCVIEITGKKEYIEAAKNSTVGKIISGSSYEEYALGNKFYLDNNSFIEKPTPNARLDGAFQYDGKRYGVYYDINNSKVYIKLSKDLTTECYAITANDHTPNTILIRGLKKVRIIEFMKQAFSYGIVYFDNQTTKKDFYEVMNLFNVR